MLQPTLQKNDKLANILIFTVSIIVFVAVTVLAKIKITVSLPFNVHLFSLANAVINTLVAVILIAALWAGQKTELRAS